jgi:hypothetical protein
MRQWDIVALADKSYAVVLQADLLDYAGYRIVAPLVLAKAFKPAAKLHLPVRVARRDYLVIVDKMAAIHLRSIGSVVGSLKAREWDIRRALDLVFVGV